MNLRRTRRVKAKLLDAAMNGKRDDFKELTFSRLSALPQVERKSAGARLRRQCALHLLSDRLTARLATSDGDKSG